MSETQTTQIGSVDQDLLDEFHSLAPDAWWWRSNARVLTLSKLPRGWCAIVEGKGAYYGGQAHFVSGMQSFIHGQTYGGSECADEAVAKYMSAVARCST